MHRNERSDMCLLCVRWPARIKNVAVGIVVGHPRSKQETDGINSQEHTTKHGVCDNEEENDNDYSGNVILIVVSSSRHCGRIYIYIYMGGNG